MKKYFKDIVDSVISVFYGMKVTLVHLFKRRVTIQYPVEKKEVPPRARNRLFNKIEDCIGCGLCARACPVQCISLTTEKREPDEPPVQTSDGTQKKLRVTQYDIDMSLCCFCGLCVVPCPTKSLNMTPVYEYSVYDKKELIYHFAKEKSRKPQKEKAKPHKDAAKIAAQKDTSSAKD